MYFFCVLLNPFKWVLLWKLLYFKRSKTRRAPFLLLILGAEVLSCMLTYVGNMGTIQGIRVARGVPSILLKFFVDNSFIFCKAKPRSYWKTTVRYQGNLLITINLHFILTKGLAIRDADA